MGVLSIEGFEQMDIKYEKPKQGKNNEQILRLLNWLLIMGELEVELDMDVLEKLDEILFKDLLTRDQKQLASYLSKLVKEEIEIDSLQGNKSC